MDIEISSTIKIRGEMWVGEIVFRKSNIENGETVIFPETLLDFVRKYNEGFPQYFVMTFENSNFRFGLKETLGEMIGDISSIEKLDPELSVLVFKDFVKERLTHFLKAIHLLEEYEG